MNLSKLCVLCKFVIQTFLAPTVEFYAEGHLLSKLARISNIVVRLAFNNYIYDIAVLHLMTYS